MKKLMRQGLSDVLADRVQTFRQTFGSVQSTCQFEALPLLVPLYELAREFPDLRDGFYQSSATRNSKVGLRVYD
jgi:hypothetical protein